MNDVKQELEKVIKGAVRAVVPDHADTPVGLDRPKQVTHGDYASNVALALAKRAQRNPRELAQALVAALPASPLVERAEIAGAGFINFFVTPAARQAIIARVLAERDAFGRSLAHEGERVMVEFVSANPTGPLHLGHGRQAALGDAIASLLATQGYAVTREFYYNDAGQQIQNLAVSVRARAKELLGEQTAFPEDGYHGEYIRELAQRYLAEVGHDLSDIETIRRFAVAELRSEQDRDLLAFGVKFDQYYLESSLYTDGRVEATVARIVASGKTFEHEGALWLRTTDSGDDKDRVYYVQYAHARMCSVLRQASIDVAAAPGLLADADLSPLTSPYEQALLRRLADFPAELAAAARDLAPHQITFYLKDLAQEFHSYYNAERFLVDDEKVRRARLALAVAAGQVLKSGLAVLSISAPEQM